MWERAFGVPARSCPSVRGLTPSGLGKLRLGASSTAALFAAGQPSSRPGRSYRYCSAAGVFGLGGKLVLISSAARGVLAGGVKVGATVGALRGHATTLAAGIWAGPRMSGGKRFVYGASGGHVRYAAIVSGSELSDPAVLRSDLGAAGL